MTWRVTVTDTASGCVARDSITVRVAEPPVADAGADVESCPYGEVVLGLHIDDLSPQYFWRRVGSDSVLASSALFPLGRMEGDYELEAVDRTTGCRARDTVRVVFHESPAVSAGEDIRFCVSDPGVLLGPAEFDSELQYRWEPTTGLLDPFSPRTGVGPDAGGTYVLHAIDPTTGCKGTDTVEVTQREGAALRFSIGREYRGASGEPIVVTVLGDDVATAAGVTRLKIEIGYDPRVVVPEPSSVEELLGGTMLDGWQVEESAVVSAGLLQVTLRAPSGASLQSAGELLRLRLNLYLSGAFGSELSLRVETDATCVEVDTEPGYVRLDTICGMNLRLIELGSGRYAPPRALPNPTGDPVSIAFGLGRDGPTELEAYDASGRRVALLLHDHLAAGDYRVEWSGVGAGVYVLRLRSGGYVAEGRVVVR